MDHGYNEAEPRRSGSFSSSMRRNSFVLLRGGSHNEIDDENDRRSVSEAGDIGRRELNSKRYSGNTSSRENVVVPVHDHSFDELPGSPASPAVILHDKDQNEECKKELPVFLMTISSLIHLAAFGILGVLSRYLLEKLFGPQVAGVTNADSILYTDLFPNMVGSFLMGWFGPVFKGDISKFSPELAVGLTTGYLGSLTTFSGWNQNMLELSVNSHWVYSVFGFLLGLFLVAYSFIIGVTTATCFKQAINKTNLCSKSGLSQVNNLASQSILLVVMITLFALLWGGSVALLKKDFNGDVSTSRLWFGCVVGPVGVWIRFYLAQMNGKGLGRKEIMKWMPFGTLTANVSACCIMAAFATMKKSVNDKHFDVVASGIQFGLCGCLSTVSTFIAEYRAMEESEHPWRAYVYALTSIIISFALGTLIYSVPVWTKGWS
ncbi:fluoride export protein 2 [Tanacetum coccineum]